MNLFQRITGLSLAVLLTLPQSIPFALAVEGSITAQTQNELIPGFTYTTTTAQTTGGQIKSYTMTMAPDSTVYPITGQGASVIYSASNINKAVERVEANGHFVMGALNSDYFSMTTGVATGIVIEDGIYKSSPSDFSSILFNGSKTTILGDTTIPITVENHRSGQSLSLTHFNKYRTDTGGLYLLNRSFSSNTRTSTEGYMVRMHPTYDSLAENGGQMTVNGEITLMVTEVLDTSYPWDIGDNDYILTAAHESGYREMLEDFVVGDTITISTSTWNQDLIDAQWASGGGDVMISEGKLTSTSGWEHINQGRNPRSALGVKEDGTLLYYAVDGRQTVSVGLTQLELANHLLDEGCYYAVNLDGGGSTSLSVANLTAPFTLSGASLANIPSDGSLRNCATFLLFVDPRIPSQLMVEEAYSVALLGSSVDLGRISVRDVNKTILGQYPTDGSMTPVENLGSLTQSFDTDGYVNYHFLAETAGTETFVMASEEYALESTRTLEIVDTLSTLFITQEGSSDTLSEITLRPGDQITLNHLASINHVPVTANGSGVSWSVMGDEFYNDGRYGTMSGGTYTAGEEDCLLQLKAGGLTAQVQVTIQDMFDDVPEGHWAYNAIESLAQNGIISGFSETEFGLGRDISRGDFVLMLYRAFYMPEVYSSAVSLFSDVSEEDYAVTAISWAVENGIASGLDDGMFGIANSITREQASLMVYKSFIAMGVNLPTTAISTLSQYQDQHLFSSYAMLATASLSAQGLFGDVSDRFYPTTALTRESMALYLYNMLNFSVQAQEAPSQISIQPNEVSLAPGESYSLLPFLEPAGSASGITWSSSDPSAVSVSSSGVITNVFAGTGQPVVTITATTGSISSSSIVRCVVAGTVTSNPIFNLPNIDTGVVPEVGGDTGTTTTPTPNPEYALAYTALVINAPGGLNVRAEASSEGEIISVLDEGTLVNLHDRTQDNEWYLISCQLKNPFTLAISNVNGYVMSAYIQEKNTVGTVIDADVGLNLRAGAGTAFESLGKILTGTQVVVLQAFAEWYKVEVLIGGVATTGFVSADYVQLN